ncbi:hypothetical protein [Kitasatospora camelliae]|uniref:LPXTG-motif cell wall-anchored protein n=1 Tax=Kitasatospora camelliae TaxID=3156397 RepID=A0AAU8JW57_9ACTN
MRAPVISRFVRNSLATSAAALTLGIGLPLLAGTPAWACGADSPAAAVQPAEHHAQDAVSSFIAPFPTSVTAGGAKVEVGVEQANFTGQPYQHLAPGFALFASEPSSTDPNRVVNLQPEHVTVEVLHQGTWKRLNLAPGCDPALSADTSPVAEPLADGRAHRYTFRIGLSAKAPKELKTIDVHTGGGVNGGVASFTLAIARPKAPTAPSTAAPAPTVTATAAVEAESKAAPVSQAVLTGGTRAAATTEAAEQSPAQLAETGSVTPTRFLFVSGAFALLLGGGVLYGVRRIAKR